MTYLIIGAVLLYLVGTMAWVLPSKREKKQMQMRQRAKACGMQIQLKSRELPSELDRGYGKPYFMQYLKIRPEPLEKVKPIRFLKCGLDEDPVPGWRSDFDFHEHMSVALKPILSELPRDVFAVILSSSAVGVEWQEKAPLDDVDRISASLDKLLNVSLD